MCAFLTGLWEVVPSKCWTFWYFDILVSPQGTQCIFFVFGLCVLLFNILFLFSFTSFKYVWTFCDDSFLCFCAVIMDDNYFLTQNSFLDKKLQHNFGIDSILDGLIASDEPAVIMADRHVLHLSIILSSFLVLASYILNLNYLKRFSNAQTQTWESFSSMDATYLVELQLNPLTHLNRAGGHLVIFRWMRFQKSCVAYYSNCTASFNPADVSHVRGGDIHSLPGPITQCKESVWHTKST